MCSIVLYSVYSSICAHVHIIVIIHNYVHVHTGYRICDSEFAKAQIEFQIIRLGGGLQFDRALRDVCVLYMCSLSKCVHMIILYNPDVCVVHHTCIHRSCSYVNVRILNFYTLCLYYIRIGAGLCPFCGGRILLRARRATAWGELVVCLPIICVICVVHIIKRYIRAHMHILAHLHLYTYSYTHSSLPTSPLYTHIHTHIYTYIYTYIHTYIHSYTHTCLLISLLIYTLSSLP